MLNTLLVRGRHLQISTFLSVQKLRLAGSVLRVNAQAMCVFRLRNRLELNALIEELSAVYDKNALLEMYNRATADPYSFWYIYLAAKRREDMFFLRFEKRMVQSIRDTLQPFVPSGKEHTDHGSLVVDPAQGSTGASRPRI